MKASELAFNRALGIRDAPAGARHLLEMPFAPLVHNHLATMHAAAQFALAEAASAECLQREFGATLGQVFAAMRAVTVKYRNPATADLLAFGKPDDFTRANLLSQLSTRGRSKAVILVDLKDCGGNLTFHGQFEWFISCALRPTSPA